MTDISADLIVKILSAEHDGIGRATLYQDFTAQTDTMGPITVPVGYTTDFASIPRIARPFIATMGKCARAACLHDWLLHLDDKRANRVFLEALKASNVSFVGRYIMFIAVWVWTFPRLHVKPLLVRNV